MKKENIVITDNFLPKEQFIALEDMIIGESFPWFFNTMVVSKEEEKQSTSYEHGESIKKVKKQFLKDLE